MKHVFADVGHTFLSDAPADIIHHLYSNIPNSGINPDDENKYMDSSWNDNGYFQEFDQRPFIKSALQKYVAAGGSISVDHRLSDVGYFYYPK